MLCTNKKYFVENVESDSSTIKLNTSASNEKAVSACLARKRRNLTKKRSASMNRVKEQTPDLDYESTSSSGNSLNRAKIFERVRKRPQRTLSDRIPKRSYELIDTQLTG